MPAGRKEGRKEVDVVVQNEMKFEGLKFLPFSIALYIESMHDYVCMSSNFFLCIHSDLEMLLLLIRKMLVNQIDSVIFELFEINLQERGRKISEGERDSRGKETEI